MSNGSDHVPSTPKYGKKTHPFDVVVAVDLLVLRVRAVVAGADWQQHRVFAGGVLQGQGDRDRPALSRQVRIHPKHCVQNDSSDITGHVRLDANAKGPMSHH